MKLRSPVVAVLGHVDHGKTTLLDFLRKTKVVEKEHGGITQRIGAYEIQTKTKEYPIDSITFIDTPGHEAFSKLRLRGANVADIALLVVDAKDSVKPQTVESISHIKEAGIPFIVVLNKIDLPEANPEKVKVDLTKHGVLVEGKGGKVPAIAISAKTGKGVPELLETILLLSSELNLPFLKDAEPKAYIIETKKTKSGIVTSAIIKQGTFKTGDTLFTDGMKAKIRSLKNDVGQTVLSVSPSQPFEILGFDEIPPVGSVLEESPHEIKKEKILASSRPPLDLQTLLHPQEASKKLALLLKADTQGSLDALTTSLSNNEHMEIILSGIGDIHKSDVFLAKTTHAIIVGFNVKVVPDVEEIAKQEKVIIKTYRIIYELLKEVTEVSKLIREKESVTRNLKGEAKILASFIIHDEKVYGIKVTKGKVNLGDPAEVYRDKTLVGKSKIVSLKIRAKIALEVKKDQEGGIILSPALDMKVGDVIKLVL